MSLFPAADPIPLPAPVWLIKLLSLVTLGLHFSAVMMLVGSLVLVIYLNARGRSGKNLDQVHASYTLAKRMPVITTFAVNLGVPPLLFVQLLYGRQIYSSSVLIGVSWLSVILLLMLAYWLIYRTINAIEKSKAAWPIALFAFLVVISIGHIYSMNMTLMLRPEVWNDMYSRNPQGLQGVTGDPTMMPRWLFVMFGGPLFGGLWAALLSNMVYLPDGVRTAMRKAGGVSAIIGAVGMLFFGFQSISSQPEAVRQALSGSPVYNISMLASAVTILLAGVLGLVQFAKTNTLFGTLGVLVAFLAATTAGIARDGIRDFTLKPKGFDVWDAQPYPNWSVLAAFLLLFVIMLGVIFWLLNGVMRKATPPKEEIAL
ncbi:MAG: hypothetical protein JST40_08120 [Armatimonadetes bacterium]|nr:hypothetical protein [Armatimonadota bacterium]